MLPTGCKHHVESLAFPEAAEVCACVHCEPGSKSDPLLGPRSAPNAAPRNSVSVKIDPRKKEFQIWMQNQKIHYTWMFEVSRPNFHFPVWRGCCPRQTTGERFCLSGDHEPKFRAQLNVLMRPCLSALFFFRKSGFQSCHYPAAHDALWCTALARISLARNGDSA